VTILGVASINQSVVELKIAQNEKEIREVFYSAEGACMEGVQRLIDTQTIDLNEQIQFWHHSRKEMDTGLIDFRNPQRWKVDGKSEDNAMESALNAKTYIAAVEWKVATGGSLVQTGSRLYQNRVYGYCHKTGNGQIIEMGYYIRY
ncbi:MAG: hypothetical protein M0036_10110, partial [Desulfobacteraceae bacterium]|nr:hypothetical protein [Desulfobacteraceae bacterium]